VSMTAVRHGGITQVTNLSPLALTHPVVARTPNAPFLNT
jgi:hypothetical protein